MNRARLFALFSLAGVLVACGSASKSAESPKTAAAPESPPPAEYPAQPSAARAESAPTAQAPGAGAIAPHPDRKVALIQATVDIEASQRELDLSGNDCETACRALGSMDRAAGRLCSLAQTDDEARRCGDARTKLYSARDKVKYSCGSCPDVSVDRNAPIPSRER